MSNDTDDRTVLESYPGSAGHVPRARLVCLDDMELDELRGRDIELSDQEETLGRDESNSIQINFRKLSRKHARIVYRDDGWEIEDRGSANGVFLNEERVEHARLGHGDILLIGQIPFRFELEGQEVAKAGALDSGGDFEGESGTMYAQHVGVIRSLAASRETAGDADEGGRMQSGVIPATGIDRPETGSIAAGVRGERAGAKLKKALVYLFSIAMLVAGVYVYIQYREERVAADVVRRFDSAVAGFIEDFEGGNAAPGEDVSVDSELAEIRKITAGVDLALQQRARSGGLLDLRLRLLFLEFERRFDKALEAGRVYEAEQLITRARAEMKKYPVAEQVLVDRVSQVSNLLDLAQVVVTFERFKTTYPEPTGVGGARPDQYTLGKMQEAKDELIEKKRAGYQMLSVVYLRFQRLISRIEEHNVRLLNRWIEMVKRADAGNT